LPWPHPCALGVLRKGIVRHVSRSLAVVNVLWLVALRKFARFRMDAALGLFLALGRLHARPVLAMAPLTVLHVCRREAAVVGATMPAFMAFVAWHRNARAPLAQRVLFHCAIPPAIAQHVAQRTRVLRRQLSALGAI
jgi:hypothetical protein